MRERAYSFLIGKGNFLIWLILEKSYSNKEKTDIIHSSIIIL